MTEGDQSAHPEPKPEPQDVKTDNIAENPDDADVLEEDDDFEEFEDDGTLGNLFSSSSFFYLCFQASMECALNFG